MDLTGTVQYGTVQYLVLYRLPVHMYRYSTDSTRYIPEGQSKVPGTVYQVQYSTRYRTSSLTVLVRYSKVGRRPTAITFGHKYLANYVNSGQCLPGCRRTIINWDTVNIWPRMYVPVGLSSQLYSFMCFYRIGFR
jgi:hypothetical protein